MQVFIGHNSQFWDQRYADSDYIYGVEPNQFLTEQQHYFQPGMKTLVVGDGEGRNGVWLAAQGLEVLSVDLSSIGLQKASALAKQQQVQIKTLCTDLTSWEWSEATYDLIVSIYVHFSPEVRPKLHQAMLTALKPNGLLILEAFNLLQLQYQSKYNSGGPKISSMLYEADMLRKDFYGGHILELTETITELDEGKAHHGKASIIRLIVQQKSAPQ